MEKIEKVLFCIFICIYVAIPLNGVDQLIGVNIHVALLSLSFLLWLFSGMQSNGLMRKYVFIKLFLYFAFLFSSYQFENISYYAVSMNYIQDIMAIILICQMSDRKEYNYYLQSFVIGALLNVLLVLFGSYLGLQILRWGDMGEERVAILGRDPNEMALVLCFAIVMALFLLRVIKQKFWKVLNVISAILSIAGVLYSGSRTGTVAVVALIMLNFLIGKKKISNLLTGVLVTGLLLLSVVYVASNFLDEFIIERYINIGSEIEEGTMANRTLIWEDCITTFRESNIINKIFGHGYDTTRLHTLRNYDAHNVFLKVLIEYGILGEAIFLILWSYFIKSSLRLKDRDDKFLTFSLLSMVFVSFLTLSWIYNLLIWMITIFIHFKIKYFNNSIQVEEDQKLIL